MSQIGNTPDPRAWSAAPYNTLDLRNNHTITRSTLTTRTDGLFGFHPNCGFKTISILDNIIECQGQVRPLLRSQESSARTSGTTNSPTSPIPTVTTTLERINGPASKRLSSSSAADAVNSRWTAGKLGLRRNSRE